MALRPFGINYPVTWLSLRFAIYPMLWKAEKEHPPATHPAKFVCRGTAKTARTDSANERVNRPANRNRYERCMLHPRSLTARPWKMVVGRLLSYWEGNFSGVILNFGRVIANRQSKITAQKTWPLNGIITVPYNVYVSIEWLHSFIFTLMQLIAYQSMTFFGSCSGLIPRSRIKMKWSWWTLTICKKPFRGLIDWYQMIIQLSALIFFLSRDCYRCSKNGALSHPRPPHLNYARD